MNRDRVLFLLGHARVILDQLIDEVEADTEHDGFPSLMALLPFVYSNLNEAWNGRNLPDGVDAPQDSSRLPDDLPGLDAL